MRGTTPSDRRGVALALPNGNLDNPSLRFGGARSGLYRIPDGSLGLALDHFLAQGISTDGLLIRSNAGSIASPASQVTPLALDRSNSTTNNGDETALEIQEVGFPVARLAAYRQSSSPDPYRWGWRMYGYDESLNISPILDLGGDGTVTVPGSLVVETNTTLGNTTVEGNATFSQSITIEGGITVTAPSGLTPPVGIGGPGVNGGLLSLYPTASLQGLVQGGTVPHAINLTNAAPNASPTAFARLGMAVGGTGYLGGANSLSLYTTGAAAGDLVLGTASTARLTIAANGNVLFGVGAAITAPSLHLTGLAEALQVDHTATIGTNIIVGNIAEAKVLSATGTGLALTVPNGNAEIGGLITGGGGLTITGPVTLPAASLPSTVIANQTIVEAAPAAGAAGDTNNVGTLLNNLAHRIMSIIGAAGNDWKDTIPRSLTLLWTDVQNVATSAAAAQTSATNAGNAAAAAQSTANTANTNAGNAQSTANTAILNASNANVNAGNANTNANNRVAKSGDTMTGGLTTPSLAVNASATIGNALDIGGAFSCTAIVANGHVKARTLEVTNATMYGGGSSATCQAFAYVTFNGVGYKVPLFS